MRLNPAAAVDRLVVAIRVDLDPAPAIGLQFPADRLQLLLGQFVQQGGLFEIDFLAEQVGAGRTAFRTVGVQPDEPQASLSPDSIIFSMPSTARIARGRPSLPILRVT